MKTYPTTSSMILLAVLVTPSSTLLLGCDTASAGDPLAGLTLVKEDPGDSPFSSLDDQQMALFLRGDALFEHPFREEQGLGPLYIRQACASCHSDDGKGPGGVTKMVVVDGEGVPQPDQGALPYGHSVRPHTAGGALHGIALPEDTSGLAVSLRLGPAVFGRGYIEGVLDEELLRVESEQAARDDGISGRINRLPDGKFGRFGVKARLPTLEAFTADAFLGDMGITSPDRPEELPNPDGLLDDAHPGLDVDRETVEAVAAYVRMLRIPKRSEPADPAGLAAFDAARCSGCHVPTLQTGPSEIAELDRVAAPIYSDLLLHDMGAELADGMTDASAGPREWRTSPLIGLRLLPNYLHDGRARTLDEAVIAHDGEGSEAADSVSRYRALSAPERAALLTFLETL